MPEETELAAGVDLDVSPTDDIEGVLGMGPSDFTRYFARSNGLDWPEFPRQLVVQSIVQMVLPIAAVCLGVLIGLFLLRYG